MKDLLLSGLFALIFFLFRAVRSSDLTINKFTTLVLWHFEVGKLESFFWRVSTPERWVSST